MGETDDRRINFKQILLTAMITGIVGVATGMLLFNLQQREPRLTYEIKQSLSFMGDQEKLSIHYVNIRNGGKKAVADVDCHVSIQPALVKEVRVSVDPALKYTEITKGSEVDVHLPDLNPGEEATISFLASVLGPKVPEPTVSVRGAGVSGVLRAEEKEKKSFFDTPVFPAIASAYAVLIVFFILLRLRRGRLLGAFSKVAGLQDDTSHRDDQNQILAYLFGLRGMTAEVDHYLAKTHRSSYWSESDRIAVIAVQATDNAERENRKRLLLDLLEYAGVAPRSIAIVHYNIARIAKAQGNEKECSEHLEIAKKDLPKLTRTRLSLDPAFCSQGESGPANKAIDGSEE